MKLIKITLFLFVISYPLFLPAQTKSSNNYKQDSIKTADEAYKLINTPEPTFKKPVSWKYDNSNNNTFKYKHYYKSEPYKFLMRDGKYLFARKFADNSNLIIIILHGVLSSSLEMNGISWMLRKKLNAEVYALDIRGHGKSDGNPGDVDYINQYEDDLADVVKSIRKENPGAKIILAGHSMGGGIELRYAINNNYPKIDGYLLFAPLLGQNTPTFPKPAKENDSLKNKNESFMKIDIKRIIGLKMFNSIGVHKYDYLPVLFFNLPSKTPLREYTYRSDQSMAPDDYKQGLNAIHKPLLVLVGSKDEAFNASAFIPVVKNNSSGEIYIIKGATHDNILQNKEAINDVKAWAVKYNLISESK